MNEQGLGECTKTETTTIIIIPEDLRDRNKELEDLKVRMTKEYKDLMSSYQVEIDANNDDLNNLNHIGVV